MIIKFFNKLFGIPEPKPPVTIHVEPPPVVIEPKTVVAVDPPAPEPEPKPVARKPRGPSPAAKKPATKNRKK